MDQVGILKLLVGAQHVRERPIVLPGDAPERIAGPDDVLRDDLVRRDRIGFPRLGRDVRGLPPGAAVGAGSVPRGADAARRSAWAQDGSAASAAPELPVARPVFRSWGLSMT